MKIMKNKIYINNSVYLIIFISLITGMFKSISIIMLIITIHELGHIIFLKKFKYQIKKIEIWPFGGITKVEKKLNTPINEEIIIAVGGIFFQTILAIVFYHIKTVGILSYITYDVFKKYNLTILLFNLLPIIPLDGSIIIKSIFEKFLTFNQSYLVSTIISIISLMAFITYNYIFSLNNYIIITFLLYKIITNIKDFKYTKNKFLLERYLYEFPYRKIYHEKKSNHNILRKETLHFFKEDTKYVHERSILGKLFDK